MLLPSRLTVSRGRIPALLAALLVAAASLMTLSADDAGASHTLTLDGSLADVKHNAAASGAFVYTNDGKTANPEGRVWVAETATHYWVAFEQSKNVKSNAYCEEDDPSKAPAGIEDLENCMQKWDELRGSDHISLMWPSLFGQELAISTDAIDEPDDTGRFSGAPFGIVGAGDSKDTNWGDNDFEWKNGQYEDKAGNTYGFAASPLAGMSSLHYNHNAVGWSNLEYSPNFTSDPDDGPGYIFVSGAEYRIAKDLDPDTPGKELDDGLATQMVSRANINAEAHNSPEAQVTEDNPVESIECVGFTPDEDVAVGDTVDVTFRAFENDSPAPDVQVRFDVLSDNATIESIPNPGSAANTGVTGDDGQATARIRVNESGTVTVQGVFDSDGDGNYDEAVEAAETCTLQVGDVHDIVCVTDATRTVDVGDRTTFTFRATTNGAAVSGATVTASVPSGAARVISVGGTDGNTGRTAGDGTVRIVVEGVTETAGTVPVVATYDVADTSSDPTDSCPLQVEQPLISATVDKTNNADLSAPFTDDEFAADGPGQDVTFQVVVQNTSDERIVIDSLRDEFPDGADDATTIDLSSDDGLVANTCDDLITDEVVLEPQDPDTEADSATCTFTIADYAPPVAESPLDNRVFLEVHKVGDESIRDTDDDDSLVRTTPPPVITVDLVKTNDADLNDDFTDGPETADQGEDQPVTFEVLISNTSSVAVVIESLTDEFPAGASGARVIDLLDEDLAAQGLVDSTCFERAGMLLAPFDELGHQTSCTFTVDDYAPPADAGELVNEATVEVREDGGDQTARAEDVSSVDSEEAQAAAPEAERQEPAPQSLPRTGAESVGLGVTGTSMILLGMMLLGIAAVMDRRGQLAVATPTGQTVPLSEFLGKQIRWARDDFRRYRHSPTSRWGRAAKQLRWARDDIRRWMNG